MVRSAQSGAQRGKAGGLGVAVGELLVDLVGEHAGIGLENDVGECLELAAVIDHAGGVRRAVDHEQLGARA